LLPPEGVGQCGGQPGLVEREQVGRELAEAGVIASADGVFDPGMDPVGGVDVGRVGPPAAQAGRQVGDPQAVTPAIFSLEQGELGARVGGSRRAKMRIDAGQPVYAYSRVSISVFSRRVLGGARRWVGRLRLVAGAGDGDGAGEGEMR